jgi:hypothetical protein
MEESMAGLEPATLGSLCEECLIYGTCFIYYKVAMRQAQGNLWNNPSEVIRNRNPAPFRFMRRSNPILRQSPPYISISQRTLLQNYLPEIKAPNNLALQGLHFRQFIAILGFLGAKKIALDYIKAS